MSAVKTTDASSRGARRSPDRIGVPYRVLLVIVLTAFAVYFLVPVWWLLIASTKSTSALFSSAQMWLSGGFNLGDNLTALFSYQNGVFGQWLLNTVGYAGVGALVAAFVSAAAGYVFAKYRFRGRGLLFGLVLAGVMIPANILAIPLYLLFSQAHATNTVWSVFLPGLVSPFGMYLCRIYCEAGVPDELIEAARIDGAGEYRVFFSIVLRLMIPALITVFLFQLVGIWNNVLLPLVMLSNPRTFPVTLGLYNMYASSSAIGAPPNIVALTITGVLVSVLPLVVAFLALQRYWQGGVAVGSVRG